MTSNRGFCPAAAAALDAVALELGAAETSFMSTSAMVEGVCVMVAVVETLVVY